MTTNAKIQLPVEVLGHILACLADDETSLRSAILVNRDWAEEGTSVLWRRPSVSSLAAICEDRRQIYAGKIHELDFAADEDGLWHNGFTDLNFPRLKGISVDFYEPLDGSGLRLGQYLQPSLEVFHFYGGKLAEDVLGLLESQCPRLHELILDNHLEGVDSERVLAFLKHSRLLKSVDLGTRIEDIVSDEIVRYLANNDELDTMILTKPITNELMSKLAYQLPCPWKHIQRLELRIATKAATALVSTAQSHTTLELDIQDSEVGILPAVCTLVRLRRLKLTFRHERELP
ncbi:hypothetical protein LTR36_003232 [Oleoguttula mirabilis]|uniref:F-box domain-containing protein n=1 Tax=Oleoguttula mirabilis TaxID=1507867 RepID=A0AAV9JWY5_9PEZI|nr:hypothetical protein LTR36_003232 [Oleoguttula mirabilis]